MTSREASRPGGTTPPVGGAADLQALVERLGGMPPIRKVVLLDRAGRVLARHGVEGRAQLTRIATLSAALHATSARLSEMAGDPGRSVLRMETTKGTVVLIPLTLPSTHLIILVLDRAGAALPEAAEVLLREIAWVDADGWSVTDPLEFEASLTRALDSVPPGSQRPETEPGTTPSGTSPPSGEVP